MNGLLSENFFTKIDAEFETLPSSGYDGEEDVCDISEFGSKVPPSECTEWSSIGEITASTEEPMGGDGEEEDGMDCEVRRNSADDYSCGMLLHTISPRKKDGLTKADKREIDTFIDSKDFLLLSTFVKDKRKRAFVEEDSGCTDSIGRGLSHMHEKQARLDFASHPEIKRKRPVCLFVNFMGTRQPLCEKPACSLSKASSPASTRASEFPTPEPSDLPTTRTAYPIKFPAKLSGLVTPTPTNLSRVVTSRVISAEGMKMLKDLGLEPCSCKKEKHSNTSDVQHSCPAFIRRACSLSTLDFAL